MHADQLLGQTVRGVDRIEPWEGVLDAPVCGALALHFDNGVLLCASRDRFGSGAPRAPAVSHAITLAAYDADQWPARLMLLLERSRACGDRIQRVQAMAPGVLAPPAATLSGMKVEPEAVTLSFGPGGHHVRLQAFAGFDGGLAWANAAPPPTLQIAQRGDYAWLHPRGAVPTMCHGRPLRSAAVEHWPLHLLRRLRACDSATDAKASDLWTAAQHTVVCTVIDELMRLRFDQNPWLYARLLRAARRPVTGDSYASIVSSLLPGWHALAALRLREGAC